MVSFRSPQSLDGTLFANLESVLEQERNILIIDDNEILLKAWKRILDNSNYCLFLTNSAQEGLEILREQKIILVISDIVMPCMDGFELIQAASDMRSEAKIILTTGYVCDFQQLHPDPDGNDVHILMKPYNNIHDVKRFVERVLQEDTSLLSPSLPREHVHLWNL